jgi:Protein of unknown function (DUF2809)
MPRRLIFVTLAVSTIGLGLWVHRGGGTLSAAARDITGDALWAAMMTWWIGAAWPQVALAWRAALALGVCWLVEWSQLLHTPALDAVRATLPGRLVLGSGFDARDLLAYALGVAVAVLAEVVLLRRGPAPAVLR